MSIYHENRPCNGRILHKSIGVGIDFAEQLPHRSLIRLDQRQQFAFVDRVIGFDVERGDDAVTGDRNIKGDLAGFQYHQSVATGDAVTYRNQYAFDENIAGTAGTAGVPTLRVLGNADFSGRHGSVAPAAAAPATISTTVAAITSSRAAVAETISAAID